jgi:hypothetical protein
VRAQDLSVEGKGVGGGGSQAGWGAAVVWLATMIWREAPSTAACHPAAHRHQVWAIIVGCCRHIPRWPPLWLKLLLYHAQRHGCRALCACCHVWAVPSCTPSSLAIDPATVVFRWSFQAGCCHRCTLQSPAGARQYVHDRHQHPMHGAKDSGHSSLGAGRLPAWWPGGETSVATHA